MSELATAWLELDRDLRAGTGPLARRVHPASACGLWAAIDGPARVRLVYVEVGAQALQPADQIPKARGFEIDTIPINPGPRGTIRFVLKPTSPAHYEVFAVLAEDVVAHAARANDERNGVEAFIDRLRRWHAFFVRNGDEGLSDEEQRGLYGELLALRQYVVPNMGAAAAVASWTGPDSSNQDFQLPGAAMEVKTSIANPHYKIHISNVRQLDPVGINDRLVLFHLLLEVRQGAGETLPHAIAAARSVIGLADASAMEELNDKLLAMGYLDIHQDRYSRKGYVARSHQFYAVEDEFPRIREAELRTGVGDVRYSVAIAACARFALADADAIERLWRTSRA